MPLWSMWLKLRGWQNCKPRHYTIICQPTSLYSLSPNDMALNVNLNLEIFCTIIQLMLFAKANGQLKDLQYSTTQLPRKRCQSAVCVDQCQSSEAASAIAQYCAKFSFVKLYILVVSSQNFIAIVISEFNTQKTAEIIMHTKYSNPITSSKFKSICLKAPIY